MQKTEEPNLSKSLDKLKKTLIELGKIVSKRVDETNNKIEKLEAEILELKNKNSADK